ncbi:nucleolar protein 16-like [Crassostrea angulata]|uniref:nucleolar protein 16-like n=1 Tax=Magallana angulata TaxID=2784310 RepID=UPI0022B172B7|nr:nucleolar protein 16-like [Crassostrea angulata]
MGRVRKKRKGAKYNYDKNRRKEWKKAKKLPTIGCTQIKEAWDPKKSVKKNLEEMGISADPNQTFKIPKTKDIFISEDSKTDEEEKTRKRQPKEHVIEDLEMEASIPQEKTLKLSSEEVKYCIYMLEKYGEDYKAMARDKRNHFQDTPKQIKKKIKTFMNIPEQYNAYIASKTSILC